MSTANNKPKQFQREIRRNICTRRRYNVVRYKPVELTNNNNEKIRKIIQYVYTFILILLFSCVVLFYIKCVHYMHTRKQTNKHLHFIWMGQIFLFVFHTFFLQLLYIRALASMCCPNISSKNFCIAYKCVFNITFALYFSHACKSKTTSPDPDTKNNKSHQPGETVATTHNTTQTNRETRVTNRKINWVN